MMEWEVTSVEAFMKSVLDHFIGLADTQFGYSRTVKDFGVFNSPSFYIVLMYHCQNLDANP